MLRPDRLRLDPDHALCSVRANAGSSQMGLVVRIARLSLAGICLVTGPF